jgi:hypothetical protein
MPADEARPGVTCRGEPKVEPYGSGVTLEELFGNAIYMNEWPK